MHRRNPFLVLSMAFLSLTSAYFEPIDSVAKTSDSQPLLKSDTPRLDTPHILKGGVHHTVKHSAKPVIKHDLSIGAKRETSKISTMTPKLDKANALKAGGNQTNLNSDATANQNAPVVPDGVGIIGVRFTLGIGNAPIINRVFPGTPAYDKGLRTNDAILAVDGVPTMGLTKQEVYNMIIGSPGTPVILSVRHHGDLSAKKLVRMDFNDIKDPIVRHDYLMSM